MRDFRSAVFRSAVCELLEVCTNVRRDHNTDRFMEDLSRTMNVLCEWIGEGDAIGYSREHGRFVAVSGFHQRVGGNHAAQTR